MENPARLIPSGVEERVYRKKFDRQNNCIENLSFVEQRGDGEVVLHHDLLFELSYSLAVAEADRLIKQIEAGCGNGWRQDRNGNVIERSMVFSGRHSMEAACKLFGQEWKIVRLRRLKY